MTIKHNKPLLVSIVGPTAVGKTALAIEVAQKLSTVIISADSRQFFKELEIGTAKPDKAELSLVKHYFINSHSIRDFYSAGQYERDATGLLESLFRKHSVVVAVGGSSLYLKALWEGFDEMPKIEPGLRKELNEQLNAENGLEVLQNRLEECDPEYYEIVDKKNGQRLVRALEVILSTGQKFSEFRKASSVKRFYTNLKIGLEMERQMLFNRIDHRMDRMIAKGLFREAEKWYSFKNHNALQTVGYSEIFDFLEGKYDKEEAVRLLKRNSRRYAKRQLTWFKKYDDIHWFSHSDKDAVFQLIDHSLT